MYLLFQLITTAMGLHECLMSQHSFEITKIEKKKKNHPNLIRLLSLDTVSTHTFWFPMPCILLHAELYKFGVMTVWGGIRCRPGRRVDVGQLWPGLIGCTPVDRWKEKAPGLDTKLPVLWQWTGRYFEHWPPPLPAPLLTSYKFAILLQ